MKLFKFKRKQKLKSSQYSKAEILIIDEKDIQDLGWNGNPYINSHIEGFKCRYERVINGGEITFPQYVLIPEDNNIFIIFSINEEGGRKNILFNGTIKNKSELKQLMNQLNII